MKRLLFLSLLGLSLSTLIKGAIPAEECKNPEMTAKVKSAHYTEKSIIAALKYATIVCHTDKTYHSEFQELVDYEKCALVKQFLMTALLSLTPDVNSKTDIPKALAEISEEHSFIVRNFKIWDLVEKLRQLESLENELEDLIPGLKP